MSAINTGQDNFFRNMQSYSEKPLMFFIATFFGVGYSRARYICAFLGYPNDILVRSLSNNECLRIWHFSEELYGTESFIKREIIANIRLYSKVRSFRGIRHKENLPVRGQRTHTNGYTQKKGRKKN